MFEKREAYVREAIAYAEELKALGDKASDRLQRQRLWWQAEGVKSFADYLDKLDPNARQAPRVHSPFPGGGT